MTRERTMAAEPIIAEPARASSLIERLRQWPSMVRASASLAAPAIAGYAAVRIVGLIVLYAWAQLVNQDFWGKLTRGDAGWYARLAEQGYDQAIPIGPDGQPLTTNLAFFPVFPGLIRAVSTVLPVSYSTAGVLIAWLASLVAAWGIFAVGNHLYGRRAGIVLAILWGSLPHSLVQQLGLTETIFTAIAAWTLYALITKRWFTAAGLCVVAGLTRPTALALIGAIGLAALIALFRREEVWWRPVLAAAIAPLGWLAFVGWVGVRLGRIDGWFHVQKFAWKSSFDGGQYTVETLKNTLLGKSNSLVPYVVTLVLVLTIVLLVLGVLERQPWPFLLYSVMLLVMTAGGTNYFHTNPRHLMPAFTLLLPIAAAATRMRLRNLVTVMVLMGAFSAWYGGYLSLVSRGTF